MYDKFDKYEGMDIEGHVLRMERSSIYDGDGYRTVCFLKGCPLRCQWCSTPESQHMQTETTLDGSITYGKVMTVEEVMKEIRQDSLFYFHSGGGMTVSGGEVMIQPDFVRTLLKRSQWEAISTAIETTMYTDWETASSLIQYCDTVFVDLKFFDEEKHKKYTGVSNKKILENIRRAGTMEDCNFKLIIRTPLIPGVNDAEEELESMGKFLADLPNVTHHQLLPYHRLGTDTYRKLGLEYKLGELRAPSKEHMDWCVSVVKRHFPRVIL